MRVVIVQYAGDYREAVQRIATTGEETYYAQKYSVDAVTPHALGCDAVTVICCLTKTPYEEMLDNGVRAIGLGFSGPFDDRALIPLLTREIPDWLILRTPAMHVLKWAVSQPFRTVASLADSFSSKGIRGYIRSRQWAKLFNNRRIEWIFNHGLNSCLSLRSIGVSPDKVIPWDWPALVTPDTEVRSLRSDAPYQLLFVGMVSEAKGIGDVVRAVALLAGSNLDVTLKVVGGGEIELFSTLARTLHVEEGVKFLGLLPHDKVIEELRKADLVVVPSRHEYNEGLPMTIYETLCARTPIVASDHPMFRANLTHDLDALIFPAGDASALAAAITKVLSDPDLYQRLSSASAQSWAQLQLPIKWAESLTRWISDSPEDRKWLFGHRLSSGMYPLHRYEQLFRN
jgi:glycosyltransferase involved in cell wall biosynthesis